MQSKNEEVLKMGEGRERTKRRKPEAKSGSTNVGQPVQERAAWCFRLGSKVHLQEFHVEIVENPSPFSGIREGDALALVAPKEGRKGFDAVAFARVYRIRRTLDATTYYFDGIIRLDSPWDVADLGIQPPNPDAVFTGLDWSVFQNALKMATGKDFIEFPVIDGKTPREEAYIRELLQLAVMDDLLGPAGGPEEEIVGMSARDRYLVGKLAPRTAKTANWIEELGGPSALEEDIGDGATPTDLRPLEEVGKGRNNGGRRLLPGEEFPTAGGTADPEADEADETDASRNQSIVPSSLGLTVCVDGSVDTLEIDARWGRYVRTDSEDQTDDDGNPLRVWRRVPCGGKFEIPLVSGPITPVAPDPRFPGVIVRGTIRDPLPSGERLVTIFLVNDQTRPVKNQDEAWVFQPELILRHPGGDPIFRRRPFAGDMSGDPERAALEMLYRCRVEFAVGHGVSVHTRHHSNSPDEAVEVRTRVIPYHEVPVTEPPGSREGDRSALKRLADEGRLDMRRLATEQKESLLETIRIMIDDYEVWIVEQEGRIGKGDLAGFDDSAREAMRRCRGVLERLREGMAVLDKDEKALAAFRFANEAMADQRVHSSFSLARRRDDKLKLEDFDKPENRSWRPFQLAFILLGIPSLADPNHIDRSDSLEANADLLWFPTGGGKTEAYLGLGAFAMAIRRLQGNLGGYDSSRGLAVIMRYTLRLLTVQQFQRAAALLCAMEVLRRKDEVKWGKTPFTMGLWVGGSVTPNETEESHEAIVAVRNGQIHSGSTLAQLTHCPWCGSEIAPGRDIEVHRFGDDIGRTFIYCGDKLGRCVFSRAKSEDLGLPILVVDDEIYRWPPSMLIATVDKFAMMAWRGQIRTLFGLATEECLRHGLLWPDAKCNGKHQKKAGLPAVDAKTIAPLRPPDLIIQDELHLISGPLGTMVALYETAVDELATWSLDGKRIRPKVIASTATVRGAQEQVRGIFVRNVAVFPPHGLDIGDDFFSLQRPITERPGRRYMGICAPGMTRPAILIRVYTALLTAAQALFERFGRAADPWMTLVGYFNTLRELGSMRRLAEDDVQTRSYRVLMGRVSRPGLAQRSVKNVDELTSRVPNREIPQKLSRLETEFECEFNPETGKYEQKRKERAAIDVVLATNMLGVGVDVQRLGLMVVNGQPKSTAEYIQATSRVGRSHPGLVCTVLAWSRPRDLSHYESFEHYHATFYAHVEARSVTPFSPRALDRGLTGVLVSLLRFKDVKYNPNRGAGQMLSTQDPTVRGVLEILEKRAGRVCGLNSVVDLVADLVKSRLDEWAKSANEPGRSLSYDKATGTGRGNVATLLQKPGAGSWTKFTVPMSLREVEAAVPLVLKSTEPCPCGVHVRMQYLDSTVEPEEGVME